MNDEAERRAFEAWAKRNEWMNEDGECEGALDAWYGWQARAAADRVNGELLKMAKDLLTAVTYTMPEQLPNDAGIGYMVRIPDTFVINLQQAIARAEQLMQEQKGGSNEE